AELADVVPVAAEVPFYSTVTGGPVDTAELGADYWFRNAREPVDFDRTVRALLRDGYRMFLESSAHPVLTLAVQQICEDADVAVPADTGGNSAVPADTG